MSWLIHADGATAGQRNGCAGAPGSLLNFRALYILRFENGDLRVQVVAHQVKDGSKKFATGVKWRVVAIGGMNCGFSPRQGEDEPTMSDIDGGEPEDATEKCAVGFGILAVEQ